MDKNQRGFGIVEAIMISITILILCAIAFITWKTISGDKNKDAQTENSKIESSKTQSKQKRTQEVTPEQRAKFDKVRQNIQEAVKKNQAGN